MNVYKRISNLIIGLLVLVGSSNVLALNHNYFLTLDQPTTYNHINDSASIFVDTGTFTLTADTPISVSITDNEIGSTFGPILDVLSLVVVSSSGFSTLFSDLTSHTFSLGTLSANTYTLTFIGEINGHAGAVYDVTVNTIPLPAATWLFGTALIGFAAYSARRSV
ncbi:VPLPA-CTERM sorting domain-containing protein [Candidatus Thiodiazotropha sp. CDECU1]|uniref:VPLPA-CTERM sorting domain-containing protein n=1 Tax=Candidatus Thiodiazotropha sp. CDECU1 TaxID=3065865 RepID=UPI00292F11E0|nr:VPLPA-CTERM sorting domain-containing protein [Candidatus Thiodiazotropha sp. CDECU1]